MSSEELTILIANLIVGLIGAPTLIDWLKKSFALEGTIALFFAAAAAGLLAFVVLFVSGEIGLTAFTWENLPNAFGIVFSAATVMYKLLNPEPQS